MVRGAAVRRTVGAVGVRAMGAVGGRPATRVRRAVGAVGAVGVRRQLAGPGPDYGQGDGAERQQLDGERDMEGHARDADAGAHESSDAPPAVKPEHQRPPLRLFDHDGLGVHGYVQCSLECPPQGQGGEQRGRGTGHPDQAGAQAVAGQGGLHHAAAADPGQQETRHRHRHYRPHRRTQQRQAQGGVAQVEVGLDLGDVRRPGREDDAMGKEDQPHGAALPATRPDVEVRHRSPPNGSAIAGTTPSTCRVRSVSAH